MLNGRMRRQIGPECGEIETECAYATDEGRMKRGEHDAIHDAADFLHALRSTHKVVDPKEHDLRRRELDRRAKEIAEGSWGSKAVREAIDAMLAAVMAAVTASTSASSG